jgi:hypothetical protein
MNTAILVTLFLAGPMAAVAAQPEGHIVVSVADHVTHRPKTLTPEDIRGAGAGLRVTKVEPLRGDREIYLLIDDGASFDFGDKVVDLRRFVNAQSESAAIGVAYITDGDLKIAQAPTRDHALAAAAIRAPKGGKLASSFCALSSLILMNWKTDVVARDVVMVTSGIDYSAVPGGVCTNAEIAIGDAQRAGVGVYAIYHPTADYAAGEWKQIDEGLIELSHVAFETGGEAYFVSHGPSELIAPYLSDVTSHLANQYLVTVTDQSGSGAGFRRVTIDTGLNGPELMAPARVWVEAPQTPGARATSGR